MRGAPERKVSEVASLGSVPQRSLLESLSNRSGVAGNHGGAEFLGSFVMNNMEVIQPEEKGKTKELRYRQNDDAVFRMQHRLRIRTEDFLFGRDASGRGRGDKEHPGPHFVFAI